MVALVLALTVPASQLRTVTVEQSCCCPDAAKCHCPDHDGGTPGQAELRACHRTTHVTIAPTLPAFTPVAPAALPAPVVTVAAALPRPLSPHAPPPPARPAAPS